MAGVHQPISIDLVDDEISGYLRRLLARLGDLTPVNRDMGEMLLNSHRRRFETQTAPDGSPWAQLSPDYKKRKKKNQDKILTLEGRLHGTLNYQAGPFELLLGSPLIYAAAQHFGRPEINLPARETLGLSDEDSAMLLDALGDWLLPA